MIGMIIKKWQCLKCGATLSTDEMELRERVNRMKCAGCEKSINDYRFRIVERW